MNKIMLTKSIKNKILHKMKTKNKVNSLKSNKSNNQLAKIITSKFKIKKIRLKTKK